MHYLCKLFDDYLEGQPHFSVLESRAVALFLFE